MNTLQPLGILLGRLLLALIFIRSGFGKVTGFADSAAYMSSKGMPAAELLLVPTIFIEIVGGLLLALGYKARWAALVLFLFMIPTTLIFHAYWAVEPEEVRMQMIQFQKNLAIMGGLLYAMVYGAGRWSFDRS